MQEDSCYAYCAPRDNLSRRQTNVTSFAEGEPVGTNISAEDKSVDAQSYRASE